MREKMARAYTNFQMLDRSGVASASRMGLRDGTIEMVVERRSNVGFSSNLVERRARLQRA